MSTEQSSIDPQLIEQTKQQIRSLVSEIAKLSKEDVAPEEFYGQFLTRVVSALAAIGGAVWTANEEGRLALQYQINLQETKLRDNEEGQAQHGRLLYKAYQDGEGLLVPPRSGAGEINNEPAGNPTDFLLVLGPLKTDLETVGVLEIFQRSEAGPNTQKGYLRFLMQMCELATDFLKSHQLRHFSDRQVLWTQLEDFARMVHASLDPRETAYTIANEGRRLIECDRVSVAISRGRKCTIEAVSGQDLFDKRSNTVRLLGKLATAVVATGDTVWYTGDTTDMAPQVEDAVQEYIDESHTKNVAVLPLTRPQREEEDDPNKREDAAPPIGALIVEQIEDSRVPQSMVQRVDVVCRHSCTALANAMEHQNLFLMPVWRALGKTQWVFKARTLPKTLTIAGAVLAVLAALIFWPARFELESKGTLQPVDRRDVYTRANGIVDRIPKGVEHGALVKKSQVLAELLDINLDVAEEELRGELLTVQQKLDNINQKIGRARQRTNDPTWSKDELGPLLGTRKELVLQRDSLAERLRLFGDKRKDLQVVSPIDGQIITWELRDVVIPVGRPVQMGQRLMEVANPDGDWQLELDMPEDNMGFITDFANTLKGEPQEVTFILATDPGIEHRGIVKEVDLSADIRGEEGNTVRIKVEIDKAKLLEALGADLEGEAPRLHQRAEVTAKIHCGTRSIGYVWFHDLLAFIQSRILFRYF